MDILEYLNLLIKMQMLLLANNTICSFGTLKLIMLCRVKIVVWLTICPPCTTNLNREFTCLFNKCPKNNICLCLRNDSCRLETKEGQVLVPATCFYAHFQFAHKKAWIIHETNLNATFPSCFLQCLTTARLMSGLLLQLVNSTRLEN